MKKILFLIALTFFTASMRAQTSGEEANLKAAFLYNFTRYIDWNNNSDDYFIIGVVGNSPIVESLNEIAKRNKVNNKTIVVRQINKLSEIEGCDILFISKNNSYSLDSILKNVGPGELTVAEQPGFAELGAAFNFVIINNKLKFEANLQAIAAAHLKAGSQLLKLAIIVNPS